jgi:transposase-like protein
VAIEKKVELAAQAEAAERDGGAVLFNRTVSRAKLMQILRSKVGCTAQTLNEWVKKAEVDSGRNPGLTTDMAAKLKTLERESRELRQANAILRKASV